MMKTSRSQRPRRRKAKKGAGQGGVKVDTRSRPSDSSFVNTFVPSFQKTSIETKLRYGAAALNFTALTASVGRYVFTANGLFDPNITGGALSPAGFSQLMLSYNHYVVHDARISVMFTNNSTTPSMVAIAMNGDSTGTSDPSNMLELAKEQIVCLNGSAADGSTKTLSMSVVCKDYFGVPVLSDPQFRGDVASNPTEQIYFHCLCYAVKGGSCDIYMQVKIDYTARFFEPRELAPSLHKMVYLTLMDEAKASKEHKTPSEFVTV